MQLSGKSIDAIYCWQLLKEVFKVSSSTFQLNVVLYEEANSNDNNNNNSPSSPCNFLLLARCFSLLTQRKHSPTKFAVFLLIIISHSIKPDRSLCITRSIASTAARMHFVDELRTDVSCSGTLWKLQRLTSCSAPMLVRFMAERQFRQPVKFLQLKNCTLSLYITKLATTTRCRVLDGPPIVVSIIGFSRLAVGFMVSRVLVPIKTSYLRVWAISEVSIDRSTCAVVTILQLNLGFD